MRGLRLQLGISALPYIAVVVAYGAGKKGEIRSDCLHAVVQHQLHRTGYGRIGKGREPAPIIACQIILRSHRILVCIVHIFISESRTCLSEFSQKDAIAQETGIIVFGHMSGRRRDAYALHRIFVTSARECLLRADLQLSTPYRIGEHGLGSI